MTISSDSWVGMLEIHGRGCARSVEIFTDVPGNTPMDKVADFGRIAEVSSLSHYVDSWECCPDPRGGSFSILIVHVSEPLNSEHLKGAIRAFITAARQAGLIRKPIVCRCRSH